MSRKKHSISIIIPSYNEAKSIGDCVKSLLDQDIVPSEIIVVDDGSSDGSFEKAKSLAKTPSNKSSPKILCLRQKHSGPGVARNLGAEQAHGDILVFVDADMTFSRSYIKELVEPILKGKAIGTASQNELLANSNNFWARCWNMGRFASAGKYTKDYLVSMTPVKSAYGTIYRAILRSEFERVRGFDYGGDYADDSSVARKLGRKVPSVKGAMFYHRCPDNIHEVIERAFWIGSGNAFTSTLVKIVANLVKFSPPISLFKGVVIAFRFQYAPFVAFKIIYDTAIWFAIINSL